jgi:uncharacterized membrane protein
MIHFPPIPEWSRLHPLIVHFPIALLLVAPLFVMLGAVLAPSKGGPFLTSALIIMVIGTASAFLALETGDAAGELIGETAQIKQVLQQHQKLAETTCILFSALTAVFALLLLLPQILKRELNRKLNASLLAAFLVLYSTGALFLINTAHQGGRLVHEFAVDTQALPSNSSAPNAAPSKELSRN